MPNKRLTPEELRQIEGFYNVSDAEAEVLIDNSLALARMILDCLRY